MERFFSEWINIYITLALLFVVVVIYSYWERRERLLKQHDSLIKELQSKEKKLKKLYDIQEERSSLLEASQEKLKKINFTNNKLLSIMAHDVKGPLKFIVNLANLLNKNYELLDDEERKESIGIISDSGDNVYMLIKNMLQWSKLQAEGIVFHKNPVCLTSVVDDKIGLYITGSKSKNITIVNDIPDEMFVWGDDNLLGLVFQNLISNSIKFTLPGGKIRIYISYELDEVVEVVLEDTGIGMTVLEVEKLLNDRVHYTTSGTQEEAGSGLGMMVAQEMIGRHDSRIFVESSVGVGTKFSFVLQLVN